MESEENEEDVAIFKRKRDRADSPSESLTTDSGSVADDGEQGGEEATEPEAVAPPQPTAVPTPPVPLEEESKPGPRPPDMQMNDDTNDGSNLSQAAPTPQPSDPVPNTSEDKFAFGAIVPKLEPPVKDEDKFVPPLSNFTPTPLVIEEENKISSIDVKQKIDDVFPSMYPPPLQKPIDSSMYPPPLQKPIELELHPKSFDDMPSPGKLSVKKEGLFENPIQNSVVMAVIPGPIENLPKEDSPSTSTNLVANEPFSPTGSTSNGTGNGNSNGNVVQSGNSNNSAPVVAPLIKIEPGLSDEAPIQSPIQPVLPSPASIPVEQEVPRSPAPVANPVAEPPLLPPHPVAPQQAVAPGSPIPLTVAYPPPAPPPGSSPGPPAEQVQSGKQSPPALGQPPILVPAYPPVDHDKTSTPLNIPSVPSQHNLFSPFYHPHFHPHSRLDKINPSAPFMQSEPQNLKIKQEVIPPDQVPPSADPLQSLKEVKVPGYSGTSISQPLLPTTSSSSITTPSEPIRSESSNTAATSPFLGPHVDNIKKEPDFVQHRQSPPAKSPVVRLTESSSSPPVSRSQSSPFPPPPPPPVSSSALVAPSPTHPTPTSLHSSMPQMQHSLTRMSPHLAHPHAFVPQLHHAHHPLMHHSLLAAAAAHAAAVHHHYQPPHPYYPYPYPAPYGAYPIPQPIPPPTREGKPLESSTMQLTSHSVTSRSIREVETRDEALNHHTTQEITQTHLHHQTTSSTLLHHSDKPNQPQGMTISHSTSSSSSSSVQHKINSSKRTASPSSLQQPPQVHINQ